MPVEEQVEEIAIHFAIDAGESYQTCIDRLSGWYVDIETSRGTVAAEIVGVDHDSDDYRAVLIRELSADGSRGPIHSVVAEKVTVI
jgi:hypothetical protein